MSARENVLKAYERILVAHGERAATVDAVAADAGVSKGGLLYHFKNKQALTDALLQRYRDAADADFTKMDAAEQGAAAYYVHTSVYEGTDYDDALVAVWRLAQDGNESATTVLREVQQEVYERIAGDVGDPSVALGIMLLGDGLYFNASLQVTSSSESSPLPGLPVVEGQKLSVRDVRQRLTPVIQMLTARNSTTGPKNHPGQE